jgi:nitroimidazol reductase NimA-like FMN-containing flavoprotein (pyridoxamine 5'-phosphate oxidase superfamily)
VDVTQRELQNLSREECLALLGRERVGRLVYHDDDGPVVQPVNFAVSGETIVLRVEGGSKQRAMAEPLLAFEVDRVNDEDRSGWSVIVRGVGEEVEADDLPSLLHELHQTGGTPPLPWASGVHNVWLRITIKTVSGRRLGPQSSPLFF